MDRGDRGREVLLKEIEEFVGGTERRSLEGKKVVPGILGRDAISQAAIPKCSFQDAGDWRWPLGFRQ